MREAVLTLSGWNQGIWQVFVNIIYQGQSVCSAWHSTQRKAQSLLQGSTLHQQCKSHTMQQKDQEEVLSQRGAVFKVYELVSQAHYGCFVPLQPCKGGVSHLNQPVQLGLRRLCIARPVHANWSVLVYLALYALKYCKLGCCVVLTMVQETEITTMVHWLCDKDKFI